MAAPARRPATYEDVLAAPDHLIAEVIAGDLRLTPRPGKPHAMAATALGEELGPPFRRGRGGPGGWLFVFEPELHLGADILVPDFAGWRRERMPQVIADDPFFTLAPDWLAEIISPSSAKFDRTDKLRSYARAEVNWVWLIDPTQHTLEVLQLRPDGWSLRGTWRDEERGRAEPFDAIELELGALWADVVIPG